MSAFTIFNVPNIGWDISSFRFLRFDWFMGLANRGIDWNGLNLVLAQLCELWGETPIHCVRVPPPGGHFPSFAVVTGAASRVACFSVRRAATGQLSVRRPNKTFKRASWDIRWWAPVWRGGSPWFADSSLLIHLGVYSTCKP
jgi:hypothetical protein